MIDVQLNLTYGCSSSEIRLKIAQAIEALIDFLDRLDGDPDFEPVSEDEGAQCDDEGFRHGGRLRRALHPAQTGQGA